jgi:hypothetical protein
VLQPSALLVGQLIHESPKVADLNLQFSKLVRL